MVNQQMAMEVREGELAAQVQQGKERIYGLEKQSKGRMGVERLKLSALR